MEIPGATGCVGYYLPKDWEAVRGLLPGRPGFEKSKAILTSCWKTSSMKTVYTTRKISGSQNVSPNCLPAVGYDNLRETGSHTAAPGSTEMYSVTGCQTGPARSRSQCEAQTGFEMYDDPNIQRPLDPLKSLMLELAPGEFAVYTVREVSKTFKVSIQARSISGAVIKVSCCDGTSGEFNIDSEDLTWIETISITAGEERKIRVEAVSGVAQLKILHIHEEGIEGERKLIGFYRRRH